MDQSLRISGWDCCGLRNPDKQSPANRTELGVFESSQGQARARLADHVQCGWPMGGAGGEPRLHAPGPQIQQQQAAPWTSEQLDQAPNAHHDGPHRVSRSTPGHDLSSTTNIPPPLPRSEAPSPPDWPPPPSPQAAVSRRPLALDLCESVCLTPLSISPQPANPANPACLPAGLPNQPLIHPANGSLHSQPGFAPCLAPSPAIPRGPIVPSFSHPSGLWGDPSPPLSSNHLLSYHLQPILRPPPGPLRRRA